jgi:hypothetical protein
LYLAKFKEVTQGERNRIDNARHVRNQSKYYGKRVDPAEARAVLAMADELMPKLERILKSKMR